MNHSIKHALILALTCLSFTLQAQDDQPLWLRKNCISPDGQTIAFSYKGEIFTVPTSGGKAFQITSNAAFDDDQR